MAKKDESKGPYVPPFIRRAMKGSTEDEILEATENVRLLVSVVVQAVMRRQEEQREREINRRRELLRLNEGEALIGLS